MRKLSTRKKSSTVRFCTGTEAAELFGVLRRKIRRPNPCRVHTDGRCTTQQPIESFSTWIKRSGVLRSDCFCEESAVCFL